ncbi:MAG: hypothetical protein KF823_15205 [Xanthomonadales bacterium]|nr:hypothetical protein [Xanthomonadales bacterium]
MAAVPPAGAQSAYGVVAGSVDADREVALSVWRGNLGQDARMAAKYAWFYQDGDAGAPLLLKLHHLASDAWVGIASAGPRRMRWQGREIVAGVLVDLAVDAGHRSLGPALQLQQAMMAHGRERFALLYGFPNPKAVALCRHVGYAPLGELVRHARPLRVGRYLAGRLPSMLAGPAAWLADAADYLRLRLARTRLRSRWSDGVVPEMDALWQDSEPGRGPVAVRDRAFLAWRFDRCPLARTRYLLVNDRSGALQAWFACQADDAALHVRDFWSRRGAAGPSAAEVTALLRAARAAGHASVSMEFLGPAAALAGWQACGFRARGKRPVIGIAASGDARDLDGLWLTSADEDE